MTGSRTRSDVAALFLNAAGRAAPWLLALGLGALGLVALAGGAPAPFPAPGFLVDAVPARLLGAGTVVAAVAIIVPAVSRTALCAVALVFVVSALLFYGPALAIERADPRLWVALAEALCVAAGLALAAVGSRDGSRTLSAGARVVIGLSLVCFGIVHLVFPDAIAGLMPGWFPGRTLWPYLTGVIQILAGGCLITGWNRRWAAAGVAAMFLCWVPLIHVPRVFGTPADPAEWAFLALRSSSPVL